jgi:hemolysin activation/secretion protein
LSQTLAPSQIAPATLRPEVQNTGAGLIIPQGSGATAPAGSKALSVRLRKVAVENGFPELDEATSAITGALHDRIVTVGAIYEAAAAIEALYAAAGFVLVRVTVPPQKLSDGGGLRIIVVDGTVETIDVTGVPERMRGVVTGRLAGLSGRGHVRLADIEQPLLLADEIPGLKLRSTLSGDARPGATKLTIEGTRRLVSGSIGVDNNLPNTLGVGGLNGQVALNSVFGLGEQIYGTVSGGVDVGRDFSRNGPVRVAGGGLQFPLSADGRWTINPEATIARTQPARVTGSPATRGELTRLTLRSAYTLAKTRAQTLVVNAALESVDEISVARDFNTALSHDRFMAARLGVTYSAVLPTGLGILATTQVSQGLGDAVARIGADVLASGIPYSRQGSRADFRKWTGNLRLSMPLVADIQLALIGRAQATFGRAVFRGEQFSLDGGDGLSAFTGGTLAVDEGVSARAELSRPFRLALAGTSIVLSPYTFAAVSRGRIDQPTVVEMASVTGSSLGLGLRTGLDPFGRLLGNEAPGATIALEYGRRFSNLTGQRAGQRFNTSLSIRF